MQCELVATHEVKAIPVRADVHAELTRLLLAAGHGDRFHPTDAGILIDLSGARIGVVVEPAARPR